MKMSTQRTPVFFKFNQFTGAFTRTTGNRCNILLAEFLRANAHEKAKGAKNPEIVATHNQVTLSDDMLFMTFILLHAESLFRIQFACKNWFRLINSSFFIKCHARQADNDLICQRLAFAPQLFDKKHKWYFHFMNLDRLSDSFMESSLVDPVHIWIVASFDGLVLAKRGNNKLDTGIPLGNSCLILVNPVTRKHIELPLGTTVSNHLYESYSLAVCKEAKAYKVVHLFSKRQTYIDCEIFNISTRTWKLIDGFSYAFFRNLCCWRAISIDGSLYWKPQKDGCDYLISMNLDDEKFITKKLPTICNLTDRLLEIRGVLGLVTHSTQHMMQVWISENSNENWIKSYSIHRNLGPHYSLIPICSRRNGKEIVFTDPGGGDLLYIYSCDEGDWEIAYSRNDIEGWDQNIQDLYIPHQNTLASWEDHGDPPPC